MSKILSREQAGAIYCRWKRFATPPEGKPSDFLRERDLPRLLSSHEALRERVEKLERLIRAHGNAQATLRNELDFAGVSLDLSKDYERADAQLIAEAEAWHE